MTVKDQRTGSDMAADSVIDGADGESIPKELFDQLLAKHDILDESGRVKDSVGQHERPVEDEADAIPDDPDSKEEEEDEVSPEWGAEEDEEKAEEKEEGEKEGEETETKAEDSEEEDEDVEDARAFLKDLGFTKKQLEKLDGESVMAIAARTELLQSKDGEADSGTATEAEQATTPSAFDFDSRFAPLEEGLKEYLGDDQATAFKGFLKDFQANMGSQIAQAQEQASQVAEGKRVIAEGMTTLEKRYPQLEGSERLRNKVLINVRLLAQAGKHSRDPEKLFLTAARMENLRERSSDKKGVKTTDVLKGKRTATRAGGKKGTPRDRESWQLAYTIERHENGLSDAQAHRKLGPIPRE